MKRFRILDGSMLKLIALLTMLIDHTASVLLYDNTETILAFGRFSFDLYTIFRYIGRISFPIYAFLLVEGVVHTSNIRRYAGTLLAFAVLSEIPWNLAHAGTLLMPGQNVLFTLFLGLLGILVLRDCAQPVQKACLLLALLAASILLRVDFGCGGFGFILMMYLLRGQELPRAVLGSCMLPSTWKAGLAFIPISLYNGKRGFIGKGILKYAFYAAYPLHLLILYLIRSGGAGY